MGITNSQSSWRNLGPWKEALSRLGSQVIQRPGDLVRFGAGEAKACLSFRYRCWTKNRGGWNPRNHPLKNRVFHYFHHPFLGFSPYFGVSDIGVSKLVCFSFVLLESFHQMQNREIVASSVGWSEISPGKSLGKLFQSKGSFHQMGLVLADLGEKLTHKFIRGDQRLKTWWSKDMVLMTEILHQLN